MRLPDWLGGSSGDDLGDDDDDGDGDDVDEDEGDDDGDIDDGGKRKR